jgi:CheY-like chemotaxis protein
MSSTLGTTPAFSTIAVIDDDADQATAVGLQLEDLDLKPIIADLDEVPTLDSAIDWVASNAQALICDVQLSTQHDVVDYNGAELMSRIVGDCGIPGVLTTGFTDDVGMWVRPHRSRIPVLVSRDDTLEGEVLLGRMQVCRDEIARGRAPDRQTHRVPLYVEKAGFADIGVALDARVGGWSRKASMRFPAMMLGEEYEEIERARDLVGKVFFARVNIGAEHETDLFFEDPESELVDPRELPLHFDEREL